MEIVIARANRPKGDTRTFRRAGKEFLTIFSVYELTDDELKIIKDENMIIIGDDLKVPELEAYALKSQSVDEILIIRESRPKSPKIQEACKNKLDVMRYVAPAAEEEDGESDLDIVLKDISEASTLEDLAETAAAIALLEDSKDSDIANEAYEAREKELKG